MKRAWKTAAALIPLAVGLSGCDTLTSPDTSSGGDGAAQATVAFRMADGAAGTSAQAPASPVEGSNGTLELEELYFIVAEFELKRTNHDECVEEDDACEKFQVPPTFVSLPLDGGSTVAVSSTVAPDSYDELDFEIEDLDDDDDGDDGPSTADLMADIRDQFPDWPKDASLLVVGTFMPEGGSPVPFRVYFEAEVEVELDLSPPVVVREGESPTFAVELRPGAWFRDGTGGVRNLSLLDYEQTGRVAELEVEVENGFVGVEFED